MYKYAEVKYGKIYNIYEDPRPLESWREVHAPDEYWVDITHLTDAKVGDVLEFKDGLGLVFKHKVTDTLGEAKQFKLNALENAYYKENNTPIEYNYKFYDYDTQSKWELLERIYLMEVKGVPTVIWRTSNNEDVELTIQDLKGIISCGAERTELLHIKYNSLKVMVNNCRTVEDLNRVWW